MSKTRSPCKECIVLSMCKSTCYEFIEYVNGVIDEYGYIKLSRYAFPATMIKLGITANNKLNFSVYLKEKNGSPPLSVCLKFDSDYNIIDIYPLRWDESETQA